jgi:hypothetical protein
MGEGVCRQTGHPEVDERRGVGGLSSLLERADWVGIK